MRNGSAILWLLIVGLVAFVLFNVVKGTNTKNLFQLPSTAKSLSSYVRTPEGAGQPVDSAPINTNAPAQGAHSPLYGQVRIASLVRASPFPGTGGEVSISADWSLKNPIDVTGWGVRGNKGTVVFIPQAVPDYNPNTFVGLQNTDIMLESGGRVVVYGSRNPISVNFRLNKCTGYMNEAYKFDPSLPNECPQINYARTASLSGRCQDFVRTLNVCVTPKLDAYNQANGYVEDECRTLVARQNQTACYTDHRGDADFFSKEWRAWNGVYMPFDADHDRLVLYDKQGLIVDEYIY